MVSRPSLEYLSEINSSKWDTYQNFLSLLVDSHNSIWTFVVLFLFGKRWRNSIMYIIILFFVLRYIGRVIENYGGLLPSKYPGYEYPSNEGYKWSHALSRLVMYSGEIIADWYLLVRTKTIIKSNRKIIWVYVTCFLFNIGRAAKMCVNFMYVPYKTNFNPEKDRLNFYERKVKYKKNKWICDLFMIMASIAYDISIIIALKKNVFVNYNDIISGKRKKITYFIIKFKQISIYRIYCTLTLSICCSPIIFMFCIKLLIGLNHINYLSDEEKINYYKTNCNDTEIENIRLCIMNATYFLMYIDQILLKHYAEQSNNISVKQSNSSFSTNNTYFYNNSHHHHNYHEYHDNNNDNDDNVLNNHNLNNKFFNHNNNNNNDNNNRKLYINNNNNNNNNNRDIGIEGQHLIDYKNDHFMDHNQLLNENYELNNPVGLQNPTLNNNDYLGQSIQQNKMINNNYLLSRSLLQNNNINHPHYHYNNNNDNYLLNNTILQNKMINNNYLLSNTILQNKNINDNYLLSNTILHNKNMNDNYLLSNPFLKNNPMNTDYLSSHILQNNNSKLNYLNSLNRNHDKINYYYNSMNR